MKNSSRVFSSSVLAFIIAFLLAAPFVFADHDININTADNNALMTLNGIGEVKAQAIIDYRNTNGPFQNKEDVMNVSGIGPATYNNIKDHITVQGGSSNLPSTPTPAPISTPPPQASSPGSTSVNELIVDGGSDRLAIAGAGSQFIARAYDQNKKSVDNAGFVWNFGDGSTAQGASVIHSYEYPGRYAVVVTASKDGSTAADRFTVSVELAQLVIRVLSDGSVEIENLSLRDIDLSRWIIGFAGQRFILPDNSSVLAKQTMHVSASTMHFYAGDNAELDYPDGKLAFRASAAISNSVQASEAVAPVNDASSAAISPKNTAKTQNKAAAETPMVTEEEFVEPSTGETKAQVVFATSSNVAAAAGATGSWKWWSAALAISAIAGGAVFVSRRTSRKEWNIIDDSSE